MVADRGHRQGGRAIRQPAREVATRSGAACVFFTISHFRKWAGRLILDTGKPWKLDPWQAAFVEDVFTGAPESLLIVPSGNGKTTMLAGLALYFLEHQESASIAIAAASRDQAALLHRQAAGFVTRTPSLHELQPDPLRERRGKRPMEVPRFRCMDGLRRIDHFRGGVLKVYASEDKTADGILPSLALIDELHRQKDMSLWHLWKSKLSKRGGQLIAISTAGEPGSEFESTRESLRLQPGAVRSGCFVRLVTSEIVFQEYAVPADADTDDLDLVLKANPFSGITLEKLRRMRSSPTWDRESWRRFRCCVSTRSAQAAITEAEWARAQTADRIPAGASITLGVDLAYRWDTTALVPFYQPRKDYRLLGAPTVLVPPRDGTALDPREIERAILAIHARTPIAVVAMDPNKGEHLAAWCRSEIRARVVERKQTAAHAEVEYQNFMEALREGWLRHSGDPILAQHVANATVRMNPYGASRFEESHAARHERASMQDTRVIDALTAAAIANTVANEQPPVDSRPVWRLIA
ncbi:MAG TPA: terminase large subunit [Candidatus Limnocylindria bacterium]